MYKHARALMILLVGLFCLAPSHANAQAKHMTPTLGMTDKQWTAALGKPNGHSSPKNPEEFNWQRCPGQNADQLIVTFDYNRAALITRQYCDAAHGPSLAGRRAEARRYFPPGFHARGQVNTDTGREDLFYSAALGSMLPSWDYHDCNSNAVPAGTFTLDPGQTAADGWSLGAGACT